MFQLIARATCWENRNTSKSLRCFHHDQRIHSRLLTAGYQDISSHSSEAKAIWIYKSCLNKYFESRAVSQNLLIGFWLPLPKQTLPKYGEYGALEVPSEMLTYLDNNCMQDDDVIHVLDNDVMRWFILGWWHNENKDVVFPKYSIPRCRHHEVTCRHPEIKYLEQTIMKLPILR